MTLSPGAPLPSPAGQRAAIRSDLAVAPLPRSFIGEDLVELTEKDGLPRMGNYNLGMLVSPDASPPVKAAADHIRATIAVLQETGRI